MSDTLTIVVIVVGVLAFPFVFLLACKIAGYGWEAGRHKFLKRKKG